MNVFLKNKNKRIVLNWIIVIDMRLCRSFTHLEGQRKFITYGRTKRDLNYK